MPPEAPEKTRRQKITSWLFERLGRSVMTAYGTTRTLYRGRSRFQSIELAENPELGKLLLLDNELQSASSDEFIYHETLVHPAMLAHPNPRQVVILGGGEGGTLREVLKHPSVERAIMIDIDREVVEACRRFLPEQSDGAFEDPRAELVFDDAREWVERTREPIDVIISDLTEPKISELSASLFSERFFDLLSRRLAPDGILSLQASHGSPSKLDRHKAIRGNLLNAFERVRTLLCTIPSFHCLWCFATASQCWDPGLLDSREIDRRIQARKVEGLRFYDGQTHQRLVSLPHNFRTALRS
ncbi:MAG: polyamine aminopropyltransferase [Candidatus Eremiobacteraeota bacterium]|nr:polyamine aminopropyltransferase [Candidatus Eremiobacteraeota bacterium]